MDSADLPLDYSPEICRHMPHFMWTARPDGFVEYVNDFGMQYLGVPLDGLRGWNWMQIIHPADREPTMHAWLEATVLKQPLEVKYRMLTATGRYRWNIARVRPVKNQQGEVQVFVGVCTDVDEWKQGLRDLSSANREIENLRALLDVYEKHSPIAFGLLDLDFAYVRVNERLAAYNGIPAAQHIGRTVRELLPKLWMAVSPMLKAVVDTGKPVLNFVARGETASHAGTTQEWRVSFFPVYTAGELSGIAAIVSDHSGPAHGRLPDELDVEGRCNFRPSSGDSPRSAA